MKNIDTLFVSCVFFLIFYYWFFFSWVIAMTASCAVFDLSFRCGIFSLFRLSGIWGYFFFFLRNCVGLSGAGGVGTWPFILYRSFSLFLAEFILFLFFWVKFSFLFGFLLLWTLPGPAHSPTCSLLASSASPITMTKKKGALRSKNGFGWRLLVDFLLVQLRDSAILLYGLALLYCLAMRFS